MWPQAKECLQPLEAGRDTEGRDMEGSFPRASRWEGIHFCWPGLQSSVATAQGNSHKGVWEGVIKPYLTICYRDSREDRCGFWWLRGPLTSSASGEKKAWEGHNLYPRALGNKRDRKTADEAVRSKKVSRLLKASQHVDASPNGSGLEGKVKTPNPHLRNNWLLCCGYIRCHHGGSWEKGTQDSPVLSLELPVNL